MSIYDDELFIRGFGTFPLTGDVVRTAVLNAAEVGYRAFDTARRYRNEKEIGSALACAGIKRDELCITTKVSRESFAADRFKESVEKSLTDLRLEYVDVLLLHWPPKDGDIEPSLEMLRWSYEARLTRFIGVSNYTIAMMRKATRFLDIPIV